MSILPHHQLDSCPRIKKIKDRALNGPKRKLLFGFVNADLGLFCMWSEGERVWGTRTWPFLFLFHPRGQRAQGFLRGRNGLIAQETFSPRQTGGSVAAGGGLEWCLDFEVKQLPSQSLCLHGVPTGELSSGPGFGHGRLVWEQGWIVQLPHLTNIHWVFSLCKALFQTSWFLGIQEFSTQYTQVYQS